MKQDGIIRMAKKVKSSWRGRSSAPPQGRDDDDYGDDNDGEKDEKPKTFCYWPASLRSL